jgi:hypothetical protein
MLFCAGGLDGPTVKLEPVRECRPVLLRLLEQSGEPEDPPLQEVSQLGVDFVLAPLLVADELQLLGE